MVFLPSASFPHLPLYPFRLVVAGVLALHLALTAVGAEDRKTAFDLPADLLERSIRAFAVQSGLEVLIPSDIFAEIRTQPVRGSMTPRQALDSILAGTGLTVFQDPRSGALAVKRAPDGRSGQSERSQKADPPDAKKKK